MTTLTLEIKNESLLESLKNIISSLKWVKIKDNFIEKKKYSKAGEDLLEAIWELKEYKKWNIKFGKIEDLLNIK
jgi:hypothetical protein